MNELISRLSELRCQYNCFDENERDAYHTLSEAIKALSDVPDTKDAVEVVRCKDCKRWNTIFDRERAEYGLCQFRSQLETTKASDYCSYGERK